MPCLLYAAQAAAAKLQREQDRLARKEDKERAKQAEKEERAARKEMEQQARALFLCFAGAAGTSACRMSTSDCFGMCLVPHLYSVPVTFCLLYTMHHGVISCTRVSLQIVSFGRSVGRSVRRWIDTCRYVEATYFGIYG